MIKFKYVVLRYPFIHATCRKCGQNHGGNTLGFSERMAEFNNAESAVVWMCAQKDNQCTNCRHYFYTITIEIA